VAGKVKRGGLRADQLKRHLERLDQVNEATKCLLVMTPDETRPPLLDEIGDQRLTWASFASLNQAIDTNPTGGPSHSSPQQSTLPEALRREDHRKQPIRSKLPPAIDIPVRHMKISLRALSLPSAHRVARPNSSASVVS
jgi:hypothetical protein